jgi:hypothetical protein
MSTGGSGGARGKFSAGMIVSDMELGLDATIEGPVAAAGSARGLVTGGWPESEGEAGVTANGSVVELEVFTPEPEPKPRVELDGGCGGSGDCRIK